jgi:cell division protein FtsL
MTQLVFAPHIQKPHRTAEDAAHTAEVHPVETPAPKKQSPSSFDKVVRRIPTLYIIIFLGVVTGCAVLIIWNTLQVNRLTIEKTRLESEIEQAEQRIIKLKAQEMQLAAPERIRRIAAEKLGMRQLTSTDEIIIK